MRTNLSVIRRKATFCFSFLLAAALAAPTFAQLPAAAVNMRSHMGGQVVRPSSNIEKPGDLGVSAHTNMELFIPAGGSFTGNEQPQVGPPFLGAFFETPSSIACIYHLVGVTVPGCNPYATTMNPSGGTKAIAIVDAYDDPHIQADLNKFSKQFGLPTTKVHVVYAQGKQPSIDPSGGGWELEESLDVEWAHAMAPGAKIYLVETVDNFDINLYEGVVIAGSLVAADGGGEVSMSWGGLEFPDEADYDFSFMFPGVVYVASTGDSPGATYPSSSPYVVAAGGTTLSRNSTTGEFIFENTWQDGGGGSSLVEPRPGFQDGIASIVGPTRGTPDLSFDSNPNTGVWVYDSNSLDGGPGGWFILGGTSVAAPSLSGIFNAAGHFAPSSDAENMALYGDLGTANVRDITHGDCGLNIGNFAVSGWDFCTGVGTPLTLAGK